MESRQLRPSIAPQQNLEWKKEAHSHRLQRSLTESNAMWADNNRPSHNSPKWGRLTQLIPQTGLLLMHDPSMQPDSKVVSAVRNYRLSACEAVHSGARGSCASVETLTWATVWERGCMSQTNSVIGWYSLFIGSRGGGRETVGYRVSCPWCNAGTISAARSLLQMCKGSGDPVIMRGGAAHIRLNWPQTELSAEKWKHSEGESGV